MLRTSELMICWNAELSSVSFLITEAAAAGVSEAEAEAGVAVADAAVGNRLLVSGSTAAVSGRWCRVVERCTVCSSAWIRSSMLASPSMTGLGALRSNRDKRSGAAAQWHDQQRHASPPRVRIRFSPAPFPLCSFPRRSPCARLSLVDSTCCRALPSPFTAPRTQKREGRRMDGSLRPSAVQCCGAAPLVRRLPGCRLLAVGSWLVWCCCWGVTDEADDEGRTKSHGR
jgi:hypothetical protein